MSDEGYRQPSPEARSRYIEESRTRWAVVREVTDRLKATGMGYTELLGTEEYKEAFGAARRHDNTCPECGGTKLRLENYDMMWHDGDLVCEACDTYVRMWDAG